MAFRTGEEMTFINPAESLQKITLAIENKQKFAYINVTKSAIIALSRNSENPFPPHFAKSVINSLKNSDPLVMKAISHSLVNDIENGKHYKIGLHKNATYLYSNVFEYYYMNNKDAYNTTVNYYVKNSPAVAITFHDKKLIQKHFGNDTHIINVAYTNYYEKLDSIYAQLSEFDGGVDYCIMDCGVLGLALASKIWQHLNMSILDFGKTLSLSKAPQLQTSA
ncbi:MAG: hypothetical protein O3C54_03730 [Proteobacteria bacterium]|nr:hypothetical protein [Pseudomonadota bacterium]